MHEIYDSGKQPQRGGGKDFHQFGDGIIKGGLGQPAGAVRGVEDLVVEDREVEGQAKTVKRGRKFNTSYEAFYERKLQS